MDSLRLWVGIVMIIAGCLMLLYEKAPGNNEVTIFGASFKLSHPSLVVIALGFLLVIIGAPERDFDAPALLPAADAVPAPAPVVEPAPSLAADAAAADAIPAPVFEPAPSPAADAAAAAADAIPAPAPVVEPVPPPAAAVDAVPAPTPVVEPVPPP